MSKIGHAAKDERGRYAGGRAGDQTGVEVYTRTWYNRPWSHVLRATDPWMRERIADAMERACANPLIGYDQGQRNTLFYQVHGVGHDPSRASACECDCSSLVCVCCMYAGVKEGVLYREGNCSTTANLRRRLMDTGKFDLYIGQAYLSSPDKLLRGDILLYEGHHVAVNLEDGRRSPVQSYGSTGPDVRWVQERLNAHGAALEVDGSFGPLTETAVRRAQSAHGLEADGVVGPETRRALRG